MSTYDDLKKRYSDKNRRLQKLKQQQARKGYNTPPEVELEIEDIEAELESLEQEMASLQETNQPAAPAGKRNEHSEHSERSERSQTAAQASPAPARKAPAGLPQRLEFHLTLRADDQVQAVLRRDGQETVLPPEPLRRSESASWIVTMDQLLRGSAAQSRRVLESIGIDLYHMIFTGAIKTAFERDAWDPVRQAPDRYRLALSLTLEQGLRPEAASRPWEFLYSPYAKTFLATDPKIAFTRRPQLRRGDPYYPAPPPLPAWQPLRVMLVHSGPASLNPVALARVKNVLTELAGQTGRLLPPLLLPEPSPAAIEEAVADYRPHVLHILAHGHFEEQGSQVALVAGGGEPHWYSARSLADVFQRLAAADLPRLLLLQACEGGQPSALSTLNPGAAAEFQPYIPAVIAMYYTITNKTGWDFADKFYRQIIEGEALDVAAQQGRRELAAAVAAGPDSHANRNFGGLMMWQRPGAHRLWAGPADVSNPAEPLLTFTIRTPNGARLETDAPPEALVHQLLTALLAEQPPVAVEAESNRQHSYALHLDAADGPLLHPSDTLWDAGVRHGAELVLLAEPLTPESPVSLTIENEQGHRYVTAVQLNTNIRHLAELFLETSGQSGREPPQVELVGNGDQPRPLSLYASLFDEGIGPDAVLRIYRQSHPEQE